MEIKKQIRKHVFAFRKEMTKEQHKSCSDQILQKLYLEPYYIEAEQILVYVSFRNEVDTFSLIERAFHDRKEVLVPKIVNDQMIFIQIKSLQELLPGTMGILEPVSYEPSEFSDDALVIMPGVAFDNFRHRIGYGGGYYDRFLFENPSCHTIALAFEYQIFDEIPHESTDISPEILITERRIFHE